MDANAKKQSMSKRLKVGQEISKPKRMGDEISSKGQPNWSKGSRYTKLKK